jgi:hypothetical protein
MEFQYKFPEQTLVFEGDDRVDVELLLFCMRACRFLDDTLPGLRLRHDDAFCSKLLLIYYATRIHAATASGAMLVTQGLGREAIIMGRCQYDYFLKMLYYDTYHDRARAVVDLLDEGAWGYQLWRKSGLETEAHWSNEEAKRLDALLKANPEPSFTDVIMKGLKRDASFLQSGEEGNPFAAWFAKNIDASFRTHWRYGSTIVHASPVDIPNVIVKQPNGTFMINVDSKMYAPNKTIADLAQRCFSAMGMLRWRFDLGFSDEHIAWSGEFQNIADGHKDEATDVRSMHD